METPHTQRCLEDPEPGYARGGWLNSLVLILHSLPQGQECVTVTQSCTPLQPWKHLTNGAGGKRLFTGGKMMTKRLGQTHPKRSAAEMGVLSRPCVVHYPPGKASQGSINEILFDWRLCSKLLQMVGCVLNCYRFQIHTHTKRCAH